MPDAKQWEEARRAEIKQLERFGVFSAPSELPYWAKKIQRSKTEAVER